MSCKLYGNASRVAGRDASVWKKSCTAVHVILPMLIDVTVVFFVLLFHYTTDQSNISTRSTAPFLLRAWNIVHLARRFEFKCVRKSHSHSSGVANRNHRGNWVWRRRPQQVLVWACELRKSCDRAAEVLRQLLRRPSSREVSSNWSSFQYRECSF